MIWFMFLCFLFGKGLTQDECKKPEDVPEAYIERVKDRDKTSFPHNTKLLFACKPGRRMSGESAERKCDNGKWTDVKFTCEMGSCRYIATPQNGRRLDQNYWPGQMTVFECNHGYRMVGNSRLMCMTNWEWDPEEPPKCETVKCPSRGSYLRNGEARPTFFNGVRNGYKTVIRYSCDDGYKLEGMQTQQCLGTGRWEGEDPKCVKLNCPDLGVLKNGLIDYENPNRGIFSMAYYECNADSDLFLKSRLAKDNEGERECQMNEQWDGQSELQCYKKCQNKDLIDIPNSDTTQRITLKKASNHLDETHVGCTNKHEAWGNVTKTYKDATDVKVTCENGTWNPKSDSLACVPKRCSVNDVKPSNVSQVLTKTGDDLYQSLQDNKVEHGIMVYMNCTVGYDIKSNNGKTLSMAHGKCNKGTLSMRFTCEPKKCQNKDLTDIPNRDPSQSITPNRASNHLKKIMLRCDDKHEVFKTNRYIDDTEVKVTCKFGKWIPKSDSLACVPKRCSVNAVRKQSESQVWNKPGNGLYQSLNDNKVANGTMVYMNCTVGYDIKSNDGDTLKMANGTCVKGTLNMPFTCQPKSCKIPDVNNGSILYLPDNQQYVEHNEQLTVKCETNYEIFTNDGQAGDKLITTCDKGNWNVKDIICKPKRCLLNVYDISKYWYTEDDSNDLTTDKYIDHGTNVSTECKSNAGYILTNRQGLTSESSKTAQCDFGKWTNAYNCTAKSCAIPDVKHGNMLSLTDNQQYVKDSKQITIKCDALYEIFNNAGQAGDELNTTCDKGNWNEKEILCKPKRCFLKVHDNSKYWYIKDESNITVTKGRYIDHGMNVSTECKDGYILTNTHGQTSDTRQTAQCNFTVWENTYLCTAKKCPLPLFNNGIMKTETLAVVNEDVLDSTKITFECNNKSRYDLLTLDNTPVSNFEATCRLGSWSKKIPKCHPKRCNMIVNDISVFWIKTDGAQRDRITENTKIDHDVKVNITCINGSYYLASIKDRNEPGDHIETAVCNYGNWTNAYECLRRECKLPFTDGTVTVNNQKHTTGVLYENERATLECTSGFELYDSSGQVVSNSYITTCRNNKLTKPLPFCKESKSKKCSLEKKSNWQALRVRNNSTINNRKFVRHGIKVYVQCNDGFDYTTDDVNITTVYVCTDTRWKPTLPVCESKTVNTDSLKSSTKSQPEADDRSIQLATKNQDVVTNAVSFTDLPKKSTSAAIKVTPKPTVEGCVIDGKHRYVFYDKSEQDLRKQLENGAVVGPGEKVYVQCLTNDYIDLYDIEEALYVTCSGNTLTQIPDGLHCTEVVECKYTVTNGELRLLSKGVYKLNCNDDYKSNLQDSFLGSCKEGKLEFEYDQNPECIHVPCSIPTNMKEINITQEGVLIHRKTINHTETATFYCGNGQEPQGREFKCDNGDWIAEDDDKDWSFANIGTFPQCRYAKCDNCSRHGNCVKDKVCECYAGYTGSMCDTVDCTDKCQVNGGICQLPNNCTCNGTRYGSNCELKYCAPPQTNARITNPRKWFGPYDVPQLKCDDNLVLSSTKKLECKNGTWSLEVKCVQTKKYCAPPKTNARITNPRNVFGPYDVPQLKCDDNLVLSSTEKLKCKKGTWSHEVKCVQPKKYTLLVYTDNAWHSGTSSSVDISIIGKNSSTGELRLADRFDRDKLDGKTLNGLDVVEITHITLSLIGTNQWKPRWIAIFDNVKGYCSMEINFFFKKNITVDMSKGKCYNFGDAQKIDYPYEHYKQVHFPNLDGLQCKLLCAHRENCKSVIHHFSRNSCFLMQHEPYSNLVIDKSDTRNWFVHSYKKELRTKKEI